MPGTRAARKFLRQFGESALSSDVLVFGSEAAGAPEESMDAETLQSISIWLDGWASAVFGDEEPTLEDFNAAFFVFCYHLCYLLRTGTPEWNSVTEYFNGDYVKEPGVPPPGNPGKSLIYRCQASSDTSSVGDDPAATPAVWKAINLDQRALNPQVTATLAARASANWITESAAAAETWFAIAYSRDLDMLCAVSSSGAVQTSTDGGKSWTSQTASDTATWNSIAWSPELKLWCAVAIVAGGGGKRIMTSPDGVTWTNRTAAEANPLTSVCWADELGLFVAVSSTGTHRVQTSPDGINWTAQTISAHGWVNVKWAGRLGLLVAVGVTGEIATSADGITWTDRISPIAAAHCVSWSDDLGMLVIVGSSTAAYSVDGINWYATTVVANAWNSVCWSRELGVFMAVASTGTNRVMYSYDGISWTVAAAAEANTWNAVEWAPVAGTFAAVAQDGTHRVQISKYVKKMVA